MLNSEDPTQWYSTVVRIEKVGFPWACLKDERQIIAQYAPKLARRHMHGKEHVLRW